MSIQTYIHTFFCQMSHKSCTVSYCFCVVLVMHQKEVKEVFFPIKFFLMDSHYSQGFFPLKMKQVTKRFLVLLLVGSHDHSLYFSCRQHNFLWKSNFSIDMRLHESFFCFFLFFTADLMSGESVSLLLKMN